jgi:two-component system NtrC family sensor kinase
VRLGLRLEWLIAFGALLVLSFVPLFFAVSRLTEASMASARERSARELGRAIGAHVGDAANRHDEATTAALLDATVDEQGVVGIAVYGDSGDKLASRGSEAGSLPDHVDGSVEKSSVLRGSGRSRVLVVVPSSKRGTTAAVLLSVDGSTGPAAALISLIALYTGVVALALLVFGYFLMTRLVVRPTEQLSRAAERVATGARTLDPPRSRTRELFELGESLRAMTNKLRADEESLRAKVAELEATTRDLRSAQETLVRSERLASVGRLAAGLAHEIGNPIAAVLGFQEILLEGDLPPDEAHDFLERMKRETERIHRVLRDLLDFARAPAKKAVAEASPGDAAHAVETVITLIAPQKELRGVSITKKISSAPMVNIAEEQLVQVLLNLLLNAGDAAPRPDGRVVVTVEPDDRGGARISVEDNGPGVADAVQATLFEPFVTTKEVGKGTGLGLAVCKGLVEAAGGTISVGKSDLGGARFVVELPSYAPASDPKLEAREKRSQATRQT